MNYAELQAQRDEAREALLADFLAGAVSSEDAKAERLRIAEAEVDAEMRNERETRIAAKISEAEAAPETDKGPEGRTQSQEATNVE